MNEVKIVQANILDLNKSSLQELGIAEAKRLIDEGFHDAIELTVFSKKYNEFLTAFSKELKSSAADMLTQNGGKMSALNSKVVMTNGATYYDYKQDPIYAEMEAALKQRKELLDSVRKQKDPVYDKEGIEIPKVGVLRVNADAIKVTL